MHTDDLVEFVRNAQPLDADRAMMRLSLFDWAICGFAGREATVAQLVGNMVAADGGAAQASLFGSSRQLPARSAAFYNGTAAHALELDDAHYAYQGHPSAAVIPAALAVSERSGADGSTFLNACLLGTELAVRLGVWLGRGPTEAGFDLTAITGGIGGAAAAARIMNLDDERYRQALNLAASRAAGLGCQSGTMAKAMQVGAAAAAGVECATLASLGMSAAPSALVGEGDFCTTLGGDNDQGAWVGFGTEWFFDGVSHRFHACAHGAQAMIEALETLGPRLAGETVETVEVALNPRWVLRDAVSAPQDGLQAKYSLPHIAAMVLDGVDTRELDSFSDAACASATVAELRKLVTIRPDDSIALPSAQVSVGLAGGRTIQAVSDLDQAIPMQDRATKLRGKARALLGDAILQPFWTAITTSQAPEMRAFCRCMVGRFPTPAATAG